MEMSMVKTPDELTQWVQLVMLQTPDTRLREIMQSLVSHLHAFVKEVRLSEDEFRQATALIARMGQLTDAQHNEVVLMAGSLGVSGLVCLLNHGNEGREPTHHNLLGPFWRMHTPATPNGGSLLRCDTPGPVFHISGQVLDPGGQPVADARVDVWHCAPTGLYENQQQAREQGQVDMNLRGQLTTDEEGRFDCWSVKPVGYPIPETEVVGQLLKAQGRHPMRPAHVHFLVVKPGFKTLISQIYDDSDPNCATDVQFGITEATTATWVRHEEPCPAAVAVGGPWYSLDFSFCMERGESRLPKPPIK
jgi:catechol 1,2-dioxygenase